MASSAKFREDRMLVSQFNRWSTLLHSDQTTLSIMERRVSRGFRQRAELEAEKETVIMELDQLSARMKVVAAEHGTVIEGLRRRLEKLQRDFM